MAKRYYKAVPLEVRGTKEEALENMTACLKRSTYQPDVVLQFARPTARFAKAVLLAAFREERLTHKGKYIVFDHLHNSIVSFAREVRRGDVPLGQCDEELEVR